MDADGRDGSMTARTAVTHSRKAVTGYKEAFAIKSTTQYADPISTATLHGRPHSGDTACLWNHRIAEISRPSRYSGRWTLHRRSDDRYLSAATVVAPRFGIPRPRSLSQHGKLAIFRNRATDMGQSKELC